MRRLSTVVLLLAFAAVFAHAQVLELGVAGGLSKLKDKELGSGYQLDDGFSLIFRMTLNTWVFFGQEVGYAYNRTSLKAGGQNAGGMAFHQGSYSLLAYATPEGSRIRPFAAGGGHFSNFVPPGASAAQGQGETKFGVNYGGGVKVRLTDKFLFRVDYRQYINPKPFALGPVSGTFKQNQFSAGLSFIL